MGTGGISPSGNAMSVAVRSMRRRRSSPTRGWTIPPFSARHGMVVNDGSGESAAPAIRSNADAGVVRSTTELSQRKPLSFGVRATHGPEAVSVTAALRGRRGDVPAVSTAISRFSAPSCSVKTTRTSPRVDLSRLASLASGVTTMQRSPVAADEHTSAASRGTK